MAIAIPAAATFLKAKGLQLALGNMNRGSVPAIRGINPLDDPAIRASMLSQGLATETGNIPGSNVPGVQTNVPSRANFISSQTGAGANIPTRNAVGLGGDAALASTANVFRQQLARQTGMDITALNREFSGAGRFNSGQRFAAIERAQERAGGAFERFLGGTALERFLQQQRNETQLEIARIGAEAGRPSRAGQVGGIFRDLASIFSQNPEFFINLIRGEGGGDGGGSAALTKSFAELK